MTYRPASRLRPLLTLVGALLLLGLLLVVLGTRVTGLPPLGSLLDPADGFYRLARTAQHQDQVTRIPGLTGTVEIVRDERGVPHVFAEHDADAVRALGYLSAQDRLFQMDFIARVAAGRLSEAVGGGSLDTDRYLRSTGMDWGARRNWAAIEAEGGIERDVLLWYAEGVNAYLDGLYAADYPLEMRLLGYAPERWTPLHTLRVLQYMSFDLSFDANEPTLSAVRARMDTLSFDKLFAEHSALVVPIIPSGGTAEQENGRNIAPVEASSVQGTAWGGAEGFIPGKGSNNWAVTGSRSATGMPILAGDMHLSLTLPAIWYEAHVVTPEMNTYGVLVPGAPLPVEAYNDHVGWAFTNTGSDQIDHYRLDVNPERTAYRFDGLWHDFVLVSDTLRVLRGEMVVATLRYTHFGPVMERDGAFIALRWTAHDRSRTMRALWGMNRSTDYEAFEAALRYWDTPMQNILYADRDGVIAIRSTGHLPVRASRSGAGLLDGTTSANAWTGRVPFEALPHAIQPAQQFLTSTNQDPADASYPYYLGRDWTSTLRSLRIDTLLRGKAQHTVADIRAYQADVRAMQHVLLQPLLDTLSGLTADAETVRQRLAAWDGETGVEGAEPLALHFLFDRLKALVWDEPAFVQRKPATGPLLLLLRDEPTSPWLDRPATRERETAPDILRLALTQTADTLRARFGDWTAARWGDHHRVVFRHITQNEALAPLWRGPVPYPGFAETLSPASGLRTTHSASWRVVVDFSASPPQGYGVYPGGQSGNPFSPLYDAHLDTYLAFEQYTLFKPDRLEAIPPERVQSRLTLRP